jgi:hypothetical protein
LDDALDVYTAAAAIAAGSDDGARQIRDRRVSLVGLSIAQQVKTMRTKVVMILGLADEVCSEQEISSCPCFVRKVREAVKCAVPTHHRLAGDIIHRCKV